MNFASPSRSMVVDILVLALRTAFCKSHTLTFLFQVGNVHLRVPFRRKMLRIVQQDRFQLVKKSELMAILLSVYLRSIPPLSETTSQILVGQRLSRFPPNLTSHNQNLKDNDNSHTIALLSSSFEPDPCSRREIQSWLGYPSTGSICIKTSRANSFHARTCGDLTSRSPYLDESPVPLCILGSSWEGQGIGEKNLKG